MSILQGTLGDFHKRTRRWLDLLSAKGLSMVVHDGTPTPSKQASYREVTAVDRAVRLHNGQIIWLRADAPREDLDQDYRRIEVFGETPQTDKALIAAVTALEAGLVKDERLEKAILVYKLETQTLAETVPASESPENLGKPVAIWLRNWSSLVLSNHPYGVD